MTIAKQNRSSTGWNGLYKVGIVGASTLKGRELKEELEERSFPARDIRLLDDDESLGQLDSVNDETTFIQAVTRSSFENLDLVFFASEPEFTRQYWPQAKAAGCALVDLSFATEADSAVAIRSPWLDKELEKSVERNPLDLETTAMAAAHPAATVLALLLYRAQHTGALKNAVVTLFDPVSEQGKRGMDELHQQTLNLLSFQPMPKEIFDMQIAFNLVSRYGEEAKASLAAAEARIHAHMRAIGRGRLTPPALQVLQAPVFHGHTASIYLELDRKLRAEDFSLALEGEHVTIVRPDDEQPSNVNVAGQSHIQVAVRADAHHERGVWVWVAADNLKLLAITAVECGQGLVAARPSGKIQ